MSTASSSTDLEAVLVKKLVVICSGRMEPSLDLTMALELAGACSPPPPRRGDMREVVFPAESAAWSGSAASTTTLLASEWGSGFSRVADSVRSGWRLLNPEVLHKSTSLNPSKMLQMYVLHCLFVHYSRLALNES